MLSFLSGSDSPITKESIAVKAVGALDMFHVAIGKLEESNDEAQALALKNQTLIDELTADNTELNEITDKNDKVISKIKALLS